MNEKCECNCPRCQSVYEMEKFYRRIKGFVMTSKIIGAIAFFSLSMYALAYQSGMIK